MGCIACSQVQVPSLFSHTSIGVTNHNLNGANIAIQWLDIKVSVAETACTLSSSAILYKNFFPQEYGALDIICKASWPCVSWNSLPREHEQTRSILRRNSGPLFRTRYSSCSTDAIHIVPCKLQAFLHELADRFGIVFRQDFYRFNPWKARSRILIYAWGLHWRSIWERYVNIAKPWYRHWQSSQSESS